MTKKKSSKQSSSSAKEVEENNASQIVALLRKIPSTTKIMDDLHAVVAVNKQETKKHMNKEISDFPQVVSQLFEQLNVVLKDSNVMDNTDAQTVLSTCIKSLNHGEKRLLFSSVLTQFLKSYKSKITLEQLKQLEQTNIKDSQAAPCFFASCLFESDFVPVNAQNKDEWSSRVTKLLEIYNNKKNLKYKNLVAETLIRIIQNGVTHDKTYAKKIVDEHLTPLIAGSFSEWQLQHFTLAYNLALLFPKHFSTQPYDKKDANMLVSEKFIDALYQYFKYSDSLPPIVDLHVAALAQLASDSIQSKINYFLDQGIFSASGIKAGADYCSKLLTNPVIGSKFPFTNPLFIKSWPSSGKRTAKRDLAAVNRLDKALKHKIAENGPVLIELANELEKQPNNFSLKKYVSKMVSSTLLPDMKTVLGVLRHVFENNLSDATTIVVVKAIETNCRTYDAQKCNPEKIFELLKLLFAAAFFKWEQTDREYLLRESVSDDLRTAIASHLLSFLQNLSLLEQTNEINYFTKTTTAKVFPTQMKAWAHELLKFENQLLVGYDKKFKVQRVTEFTEATNNVRKQLQTVREKLVSFLAKSSDNQLTARLCSLKVLINHILICQLNNTDVLTLDMANDLYQVVVDLFDSSAQQKKPAQKDNGEQTEEPAKPIEVFVDILIGLATVEPSLTYALRMCLFAFSSYLNDECFKLLFQCLQLGEPEKEAAADEDSDEEMTEASDRPPQQQNGKAEEKEVAEEQESESDMDDDEEDEELNGADSDEEDDVDPNDQDAFMFKMDKLIAAQFKIRKLEALKRKQSAQPPLEIAKNILTMLEGLIHPSTSPVVLIQIFIECIDFVRGLSASPKPQILDRVMAIAKNISKADGRAMSILDSIASVDSSSSKSTHKSSLSKDELEHIRVHALAELSHVVTFFTRKKLVGSKATENSKNSIKSLLLDKTVPFLLSILDRLVLVANNAKLVPDSTRLICRIITRNLFRFKLHSAFALGIPSLLPAVTSLMTKKLQSIKTRSKIIEFYYYAATASKKETTFFADSNDFKNTMDLLIRQCPSFEKKMNKTHKAEFAHFLVILQKMAEVAKVTKIEYNPLELQRITSAIEALKTQHHHKALDAILQAFKGVTVSDSVPVHQAEVKTPSKQTTKQKSGSTSTNNSTATTTSTPATTVPATTTSTTATTNSKNATKSTTSKKSSGKRKIEQVTQEDKKSAAANGEKKKSSEAKQPAKKKLKTK